MSYVGSMLSLDSRNSITTERSSIIVRQSSGLCHLDVRRSRGRRLLLGQLIVVPALPLIILMSFTLWRITASIEYLHKLNQFEKGIVRQRQRDDVILALRLELMESVHMLLDASHTFQHVSTTYKSTDQNLAKVEKQHSKYDIGDIRTALANLTIDSFSCKSTAWGKPLVNACYDVIDMYVDVIDELSRTPEDLFISGLPYQVHSHWTAILTFLEAQQEFNHNTIFGIIALETGDLSRRSSVAFIQSIDVINYHISDILSFDHHLYLIYNDSLSIQLDNYIQIIADNLEHNDSSVSLEWDSFCRFLEYDLFHKMKKEIYSGLDLEGLRPAFNALWPIIGFYICSLVIQIPILIFIIENARITGISIVSSVALFSSKVGEINTERRRTDLLLKEMLPKSIARRLLNGSNVSACYYNSVTVYFSDIAGFHEISSTISPMQVVDLLNDVYSLMDSKLECYDVYKVETIGCVYMVASGIPVENGGRHVTEICSMALDLLMSSIAFNIAQLPGYKLQLRIGIHTGL